MGERTMNAITSYIAIPEAIITTDTLPTLSTSKWRVDAFGLHILEPLTFDEWTACGESLWQYRQSLAWAVGDWYAYGENRFGEDAPQAFSVHEYSEQTISNYASVSRAFPPERRKFKVSHSHYDAARGLRQADGSPDTAAQDTVLGASVEFGYSREDVREIVRTRKGKVTNSGDNSLPHGGNDTPPKLPPTYAELLALAKWVAATDMGKLLNYEVETLIDAWQQEARQLVGALLETE
jgi:hypothetical protein